MINISIRESNRCNGDVSLYVTFPFSNYIVDTIRSMPNKFWDKDNKQWEVAFKSLPSLLNALSKYEINIECDDPKLLMPKDINVEIPSGFTFKTTPYEYQMDGVKYGLVNKRWLLGDDMGLGKALALNTKIYTPNGYKFMKDIEVGDYVFAKDGSSTKVTAVYNHSNVEMYRITFSDGVSIDCCKDHLWKIHDQHGVKVVDTKWFTEKDQFGNIRKDSLYSVITHNYKYWIDRCAPVQFEYQDIPINPYILGAILGDGGLTSNSVFFTTVDEEMVDNINNRLPKGYELCSSPSMKDIEFFIKGSKGKPNLIKQGFIDLGLWKTNSHTKFIPDIYKYNSISVRTEVLQGLIDTDGYATKDNLLQYTTVSKQLCEDVRFLVESLGGMVRYSEKYCSYDGKITGKCYNLTIKFDKPQLYCTLNRKKSLLKDRHFKARRNIISVEKIENADAKCITVDNAEHLYLIDHFVVTHNTKQAIDCAVIKKLTDGYKHCLVVCGVNGLKWNWVNEISNHSDEQGWIIGQKTNSVGNVVIGSNADKYNQLLDITRDTNSEISNSYFLITNIESLRSADIVGEISRLCDIGVINMIVLDEAHKALTNTTSQQGKGLLKLKAETMIAMTGTPLLNKPLDVYGILKWLGYEKHSFYSFRNHFCIMGGYGGYQIMGYKNLDELQEQLNEIMLRRRKDDVLDLPEKTYIDEYVDMTPKQAIIYKEVTNEVKANIDQIKTASNPLAEMIRMRQATGYTGILSSQIQESAKLDRMEEIVDDTIENGEKVLVFSNWTSITDEVCRRLSQKYDIAVITGDTKDEERQRMVDRFQNDPNCKVVVGTSGAMGTGLTLTAATVEIFLDHAWNRALYDQCVDRAYRIGQRNMVTIYNIMAKNTIDERVWKLVNMKGKMADALVDKSVDFSKSELVDFLLGD